MISNAYPTYSLLICICIFISCASPEKAMQKGQYYRALRLANKQIQRGKNITANEFCILQSTNILSARCLEDPRYLQSDNIKDWKRSQTNFNKVLSAIAKSDATTNGLVSDNYNKVCDIKYELDLRIVDYYYQEGLNLLAESKATGRTQLAREAYFQFQKSINEGAKIFYPDLDILKTECLDYGSIYISAPSELRLNSIFLRDVNYYKNTSPDCVISLDYGYPDISKSETERKKEITKKIVVGKESFTDKNGVKRERDIYKKVVAKKRSREITYTARQRMNIYVLKKSSECYLETKCINLNVTDTCIEISYSGDLRAVKTKNESSCNDHNIICALKKELNNKLDSKLYIN